MSAATMQAQTSSARLPSPPPMAEDQRQDLHIEAGQEQTRRSRPERRIHPGTKAADITEPPLIDLFEIDSPFALAEHLKSLHYSFTHPTPARESPISKDQARALAKEPAGIDRQIWLYELARFLVQKINNVIVALFSDNPPCSAQTCSEMRASEWQYLCAVHNPPKGCCAIDYCCHTLDWAANSLTSPKEFPSRLSLGTENTVPAAQVKTITNIMRRVYRIFAHAWFSHREMFWKVEGSNGLYVLFKTVCDAYSLIPDDNYTIPAEAEGGEPADLPRQQHSSTSPAPMILKRADGRSSVDLDEPSHNSTPSNLPNATARRHRQTPSKGALVDTVLEENEDDEGNDSTATESEPRRLTRADTKIHLDSVSPTSSSYANLPSSPPQTSPIITSSFPSRQSSQQDSFGTQHGVQDTGIEEMTPSNEPQQQGQSQQPPPPLPLNNQATKPFSPFTSVSFSPVSPKAATFEEMEKEIEEANLANSHANEVEGEAASSTGAGEGDDATKTVED